MLDIGWQELLVIGVLALLVVGPKELPGLLRTVGQWAGRARSWRGISSARWRMRRARPISTNSRTSPTSSATSRTWRGSITASRRSGAILAEPGETGRSVADRGRAARHDPGAGTGETRPPPAGEPAGGDPKA